MLVLTRKAGEHITIGTDTVVLVTSVVGNRVRLAIQAPRTTKILRGELDPLDEATSAERAQRRAIRLHRLSTEIIHD